MAPGLARHRQTVKYAVVHGRHPLRGYPVTWHLTPLPPRPNAGPEFLVERADGEIDDEIVWQCAEKDAEVLSASEAAELVRKVAPGHSS